MIPYRAIEENMENSKDKIKQNRIEAAGYPFPDFNKLVEGHPDYDKEFDYLLNFTNYVFDAPEMKKHTEQWLGRSFPNTPDYKFVSIGNIAWALNNGAFVKDVMIQRASEKMNKISEEEKQFEQTEQMKENSRSPFDKRTDDLVADLELYIDDFLQGKTPLRTAKEMIDSAGTVNQQKIRKFVSSWQQSLSDSDVVITKERQKPFKDHITAISKAMDAIPVVVRAERKKAPADPSKLVKKLKYLTDTTIDEFQVVSIDPEKIIGAANLLVYNAKTRKLGQYVAFDENGLSVKGSTIENYDVAKSFQKTLRKPKEVLTGLVNCGKVSQSKVLESIKTEEGVLSGRINKETILVKIF